MRSLPFVLPKRGNQSDSEHGCCNPAVERTVLVVLFYFVEPGIRIGRCEIHNWQRCEQHTRLSVEAYAKQRLEFMMVGIQNNHTQHFYTIVNILAHQENNAPSTHNHTEDG